MGYEFNLLHHIGVVATRLRAVAETQEVDENTPFGRMVKTWVRWYTDPSKCSCFRRNGTTEM